MMVKAKIPQQPGDRPLLLIGVYVQPATKQQILRSLELAARRAIESQRFSAVVIAGDLNSTEEEL